MIELTDKQEIVRTLNELIEMDYVTQASYNSASEFVDDLELCETLASFRTEHHRHIEVLSKIVANYDGVPPTQGDVNNVSTQGKVALTSGMDDRTILESLKYRELQTGKLYTRARAHFEGLEELQAIIDEHLSDERAHRKWLEERLV